MRHNFCAFILSHGRADNVITYKTLRHAGYTGRIVVIIDNQDKQADKYHQNFPGQVYVFDKPAIAATVDQGDNFNNLRTTTHVRNAIFEAAKELGIDSFVMLDDDYTDFRYKFSSGFQYGNWFLNKNLNFVFNATIQFLYDCKIVTSIAYAQGGDFMGGSNAALARKVTAKRKLMNSFFCLTERPFQFISRLNEDVNTYLALGARGVVFLTINQFALQQKQTQTNAGGMSDAYLEGGTFVKSFYSVMYAPSCTKVSVLGTTNPRLHHRISWKNAVPCILSESLKKK
jgi:hypothetical protein